MSFRIKKFIAKTSEEVETFINLLPVDVYILGAPQQIKEKNKLVWIVWIKPYSKQDSTFIKEDQ